MNTDYFSDPGFRTFCKGLTLITDSREKENGHILGFFRKKQIPVTVRKLEFGDYSLCSDLFSLEQTFCIERKNSTDELRRCLTDPLQRLEKELSGARSAGMKLSLLIEDSAWAELIAGDPAHRIPPGKLFRMLYRLSSVTAADVNFSPSRISGAFIYETLLLRAYLLYLDARNRILERDADEK